MSTAELREHKNALLALRETLSATCTDDRDAVKGLTMRIYQPHSDSLAALRAINAELFKQLTRTEKVQSGAKVF